MLTDKVPIIIDTTKKKRGAIFGKSSRIPTPEIDPSESCDFSTSVEVLFCLQESILALFLPHLLLSVRSAKTYNLRKEASPALMGGGRIAVPPPLDLRRCWDTAMRFDGLVTLGFDGKWANSGTTVA